MSKTICLAIILLAVTHFQLIGQDKPPAKPPRESADLFQIPDDLRIDQVLAEPQIAQPVFCNFDERGRLWVVEYRQYPEPAGLKAISKDKYYRTVYDKTPVAPPNHVRGKDRISIHEDTNGDGQFDSHKVFVDGLNITTAVERGRGGVWVLNPPYLLFYPDRDNNDIPDSDPVVHLSGFGIEDTHSCTNSLRWGPDGWLYAAQGSTVTGSIIRPGIDKTPARSMGQLIWRYHPERRIYEIFAEGGGNAFGVELDSKGRIFSGHNGGNTRGFHYPQGGYLQKGFTKHGALSNPYAFGYFPPMKHKNVERFTHNFLVYQADALPEKYRGKLFGVEPLQGRVVESIIQPLGSTFETKDVQHVVKTTDSWFTPVDIKLGPDGGIYVCDWYDDNVSHLEASVGKTDKQDGRIYRLIGKQAKPVPRFDMTRMSSQKIVAFLNHPNRWFRQTALRVLGDRKDQSILPLLRKQLLNSKGQGALESLWAINLTGNLVNELKFGLLEHENPFVRLWTFRLICDSGRLPDSVADYVEGFVFTEKHLETRTQIAASARRLDTETCLKICGSLLHHESDSSDPYQPLLIWWAIESKCGDGNAILDFTRQTPRFWSNRLVIDHLADRFVRRFSKPGRRVDFITLSKLLASAQKENPQLAKKMLVAFETSTRGMLNLDLPAELLNSIAALGGGSLELKVRQKNPNAIQSALLQINHSKANTTERVRLIRALGEIRTKDSLEPLLQLLESEKNEAIQIASLQALQQFDSSTVGKRLVRILPGLKGETRKVTESILVSRSAWCKVLLNALERKLILPKDLEAITPRRMLFHDDAKIQKAVNALFGDIKGATDAKMRATINQYYGEITEKPGSPYEGKKLFIKHCSKCHQLYQVGGDIGPNLTSYQRSDLRGMLLHVVNPSAEIREGYENLMFALDDGRVISGFVKDKDNQKIIVRTAEGTDVSIEIDSIENQKAVLQSIMPSNLLAELTPQQRRDLFAYLRSTQPLNN